MNIENKKKLINVEIANIKQNLDIELSNSENHQN